MHEAEGDVGTALIRVPGGAASRALGTALLLPSR
jgi:hypothetical protein